MRKTANHQPVLGMPRRSTLGHMPRRIFNWTYRDVTGFLKENGFNLHKQLRGSHEIWQGPGDPERPAKIVEVSFIHGSYKAKTLKTMIHQSGIPQEEWINWA